MTDTGRSLYEQPSKGYATPLPRAAPRRIEQRGEAAALRKLKNL